MPVSLLLESADRIVILSSIVFQLVIVAHLITWATTEVKLFELTEFVKYL